MRGARPALDEITLDVEREEFVFLVGESGSGKSTFLRLVLREERPTEGEVFVAGRNLAKVSKWRVPQPRPNISTVCQSSRHLRKKNESADIPVPPPITSKTHHHTLAQVTEVISESGPT